MKSTKFPVKVGSYKAIVRLRGNSYQMRMWLAPEGRMFSHALDTTDEDVARERATDKVMELVGKMKSGKSIVGQTLQVMLERFLAFILTDKSASTVKTQTLALRRGMEFIETKHGKDVRATDVDGKCFREYPQWRGAKMGGGNGSVRMDVCKHELLYIRQMFLWGMKQEPPLCNEGNVPNWGDIKVEETDATREYITHGTWDKALAVIKDAIGACDSPVRHYNRQLLYWYMMAISACGLRTGELYQLRNKDLTVNADGTCEVFVRAETSKVRSKGERTVEVAADGNPFLQWLKVRGEGKPEQFVFCSHKGGSADRVYLDALREVRPLLENAGVGVVDPYHGRHMFITRMIKAGVIPLDVAGICGTSLTEIEATYYNVTSLEASKKANKKVAAHV